MATPEALKRFKREEQSASALNHPNICTIHEISEHEGRPFIAMEMMKGKTLKHTISGKATEIDQVLNSERRFADALDYQANVSLDYSGKSLTETWYCELDFELTRPDVMIHPEKIRRVILLFQGRQALIILSVCFAASGITFLF